MKVFTDERLIAYYTREELISIVKDKYKILDTWEHDIATQEDNLYNMNKIELVSEIRRLRMELDRLLYES